MQAPNVHLSKFNLFTMFSLSDVEMVLKVALGLKGIGKFANNLEIFREKIINITFCKAFIFAASK